MTLHYFKDHAQDMIISESVSRLEIIHYKILTLKEFRAFCIKYKLEQIKIAKNVYFNRNKFLKALAKEKKITL